MTRKLLTTDKVCAHCHEAYEAHSNNSVYCSRSCKGSAIYERHMLEPEWRINKLIAMAKSRATDKGLDFNLDITYMRTLWTGSCSLSGIPLVLERNEKGRVHPYAPSIDRIIPSLGYVQGNVRIICYQMNVALSEFGLAQFDELVNKYAEHNGGVA